MVQMGNQVAEQLYTHEERHIENTEPRREQYLQLEQEARQRTPTILF